MGPDQKNLDELRIDRSPPKEGRPGRWLALAAIPAVVVIAGAWWLSRPGPARVRTAVVSEDLTPAERQTVLNASGYVTARRQATVSSKVTGKVVEILIEEGMEVVADQVLARLDASNIQALLDLSEAEVRAARSALKETRVRLEEARLDLERAKNLMVKEIASQAELDRAQAEVHSLEARLVRQREEVKVAERQVTLRRQELADTVIRAPFAGVVVSKNAQPGEMISPVSAGGGFTRTGICTLVDMGSLEIEVDVNESYINRVVPGQPVEAALDAYPGWQIPGKVIAIVPTADRQKATVRVRIGFDELDPRILPDMGIKVAFQDQAIDEETPITALLTVPRGALRRDNGQDVVFAVSGGKVERRAVQVGPLKGETVHVVSGLSAGERVVVEGPPDLKEGDRVEEVDG